MIISANDAANALADYVDGDVPEFVQRMNNKARELNLKDTVFTNPSGVYNEEQYTTAQDIAILMRYALTNDEFNRIFSIKAWPWVHSNGTSQIILNPNKLFWSYEGVDGAYALYNEKGRQTAITSVSRGDQRLIAVELDSEENKVFEDSVKILDYGFSNYRVGKLVQKGQFIKNISVGTKNVDLICNKDVYYTFPIGNDNIKNIKFDLNNRIKLPITKNQTLGTATYILKDNSTIEVSLYPKIDLLPESNYYTIMIERLTEYKELFYSLILLGMIEIILIINKAIKLIKKLRNKK
jgi:D-alanyl-D-alanine carboxypeptidase/D-alanyl-D-alanine carboxypeptidase (penicillin-binding protein 5/6)